MRKNDPAPPASDNGTEPIEPVPHVIAANAIYSVCSASRALGLPKSSLPREIRQGRLRVAKRAGRYFILGQWLQEWLEGGERRREEKSGSERDTR